LKLVAELRPSDVTRTTATSTSVSEKAGHRVMTSLTRFIEGRLKLQVNAQKSAVDHPWHRSFLGFTVTDDPQSRRRIADKAVARFKTECAN
jgi:RNA-directed DNA polymerase